MAFQTQNKPQATSGRDQIRCEHSSSRLSDLPGGEAQVGGLPWQCLHCDSVMQEMARSQQCNLNSFWKARSSSDILENQLTKGPWWNWGRWWQMVFNTASASPHSNIIPNPISVSLKSPALKCHYSKICQKLIRISRVAFNYDNCVVIKYPLKSTSLLQPPWR